MSSNETFSQQNSLPILPLPDLEKTIDKYLETVRPFISEESFHNTANLATDFKNGIGSTLQERLKKRHEMTLKKAPWVPQYSSLFDRKKVTHNGESQGNDQIKSNWLIDWWNEYSYLRFRESIVLNVSFFFVFDYTVSEPIKRASTIIHYALDFKEKFLNRRLDPGYIRKTPQCMMQYHFLFNSCRIPSKEKDYVEVFDPKKHRFFCICIGGRFFSVSETTGKENRILSIDELERILSPWYEEQFDIEEEKSPASLSAAHRDVWAQAYSNLIELPNNEESIRMIQASSFLVCFDKVSPFSRDEIAHECWHGYGKNRWFDKSMQFIVFSNGKAGFLGEHSMFDATTPAHVCNYIQDCAKKYLNPDQPITSNCELPLPKPLVLSSNDLLSLTLNTVTENLEKEINCREIQACNYYRFGKGFIKSHKMSPDSFVQMAIQYAYFRLMHVCCATYESVGMKKFQWGRTETCRSVSSDSVEFCNAMDNPDLSLEEKAQYIREAVETHSNYMAECSMGNGVDRHLLGLRLCLKDTEVMPDFFLDPAYNLSCHWTLSTSQIPSDHFEGYGWGEVVPDGFGIAYMVREDRLMFNIAGQVGDQVPDLDISLYDRGEYFVKHHKKMRVKWLRSCLEESLDMLFETLKSAPGGPRRPSQAGIDDISSHKLAKLTKSSSGSLPVASKRPPSIHELPAHLGLSLAYPRRSEISRIYAPQKSNEEEASGVIGEDLGLIEFEFQWGASKKTKKKDSGSEKSGYKLLRVLTGLSLTSKDDAEDKKH